MGVGPRGGGGGGNQSTQNQAVSKTEGTTTEKAGAEAQPGQTTILTTAQSLPLRQHVSHQTTCVCVPLWEFASTATLFSLLPSSSPPLFLSLPVGRPANGDAPPFQVSALCTCLLALFSSQKLWSGAESGAVRFANAVKKSRLSPSYAPLLGLCDPMLVWLNFVEWCC